MPRFYPLKVKDVRRETEACVSISFEVPGSLLSEFAFLQGQHLTLRTYLDGEEVRRSYSICTSPSEVDLRVAVKKISGGQFSTYANERLCKGDTLDVMTPLGSFHTQLDPAARKHYVAFAAGSGITPIMSIMKTTLETEPGSRFTLFYGNSKTDTIIFREDIEALKNRYMRRLSVHHVLSREDLGMPLFYGRITGEKCRKFFQKLLDVKDIDEFFLCGPESMIGEVKEALTSMGISERRIHFELFTSPVGKLGEGTKKWEPPKESIASSVTITLDGKTFQFDLMSSGDTILEGALKAGADLPFACKGGVCCTCKAKLLDGGVDMEVNYGLEPEEVEAGYVLTCQSHPKTGRVVLSFDE
jgi:ring-1,2-phenylacetyl-CoA epoxidase subunit PaaE